MFENPHIIYVISKLKHEELLAESRMNRLVKCAKRKKRVSFPCRFMLYTADILIKVGITIKQRWADIEESSDSIALSLDNE